LRAKRKKNHDIAKSDTNADITGTTEMMARTTSAAGIGAGDLTHDHGALDPGMSLMMRRDTSEDDATTLQNETPTVAGIEGMAPKRGEAGEIEAAKIGVATREKKIPTLDTGLVDARHHAPPIGLIAVTIQIAEIAAIIMAVTTKGIAQGRMGGKRMTITTAVRDTMETNRVLETQRMVETRKQSELGSWQPCSLPHQSLTMIV
jgi:hypothetical protein